MHRTCALAFLLLSCASLAAPPAPDFNADGKADIAWSKVDGSLGVWDMNGAAPLDYAALPSEPFTTLVLSADFDGDGKTDLLARRSDGSYVQYFMDGSTVRFTHVIPANGWTVIGTGDFNGDGKADLIWSAFGQGLGIWLMDGGTTIDYAGLPVKFPGSVDQVVAVADFDGDGKSDLLVVTNGHVRVLLMNGLQVKSDVEIYTNTTVEAGIWTPVLTGDFNGDGKADIVWADYWGSYGVWLMDGTSAIATATLVPSGGTWRVAQAMDLDGDGKDDLVWRDSASASYGAWLMDGTAASSYGVLLYGGSGWELVDGRDLDGDGKADLLWHHTDGRYGVWMMNGLTPLSYTTILYPAASGGTAPVYNPAWTALPTGWRAQGASCSPLGC